MGPRRIVREDVLTKAKSGRKLTAVLCSDLLVLLSERKLYRMPMPLEELVVREVPAGLTGRGELDELDVQRAHLTHCLLDHRRPRLPARARRHGQDQPPRQLAACVPRLDAGHQRGALGMPRGIGAWAAGQRRGTSRLTDPFFPQMRAPRQARHSGAAVSVF
jgi:hypothetical protein